MRGITRIPLHPSDPLRHTELVGEQTVGAAVSASQLESNTTWHAIKEEFLSTSDAAPVQRAMTTLRDALAIAAYQATIEPALPESVALLAGGAYGRGDTFPYSALNLVLVVKSEKEEQIVQSALPDLARLLWTSGLRIHSAVLTVAGCLEAVAQAGRAAKSLLGRRFLAGDSAVADNLEALLPLAFQAHAQQISELLCGLAQARHQRFEHTIHFAEPDLRDIPGGTEDLRLLDCLAMLRPDRAARSADIARAAHRLAMLRCFLHYRAGGDQNLLTFAAQGALPAGTMPQYFEGARAIFNEARRAMEETAKTQSVLLEGFREYRSRLSNAEFTVSRDRLLLRAPGQLQSDPAVIPCLLEFISRHDVPIAGDTARRLEAARESFAAWCSTQPLWPLLKPVLSLPHAALAMRALEDAGLMVALLPDWRAVEHTASADAGHGWTLDEYALRTLDRVRDLRTATDPARQRFAQLLAEIDDVAVLLLALLLQSLPSADALAKLGLPDDARATVEFLVLRQSDLSDVASGRDMEDPATARHLAQRAETIERLKLLCVMTYARIAAARTESDAAWPLEQLWRAYSVASHELTRELETDRIQEAPPHLKAHAAFLKGFPLRYLRAHTSAEIEGHISLFERSRATGAAVQLDPIGATYRLTVTALDRPAIFAAFAGAISSFGLDILKAEAFANASGVVLDTFVVADPKRMLQQNPTEADRLTDMMQRIATGRTNAQKLLRSRPLPEAAKRPVPAQVTFDSEACPTATLVEIATDDRPGLLYSLATVFSTAACNIDVVLVDTKGHRAIDVFYVAQDGRKLTSEMQSLLKDRLVAAC